MGTGIDIDGAVTAMLPMFPDALTPVADTIADLARGRRVRSDRQGVVVDIAVRPGRMFWLSIQDVAVPRWTLFLALSPFDDAGLAGRRRKGLTVDQRGPVDDPPGPWRSEVDGNAVWGLFNVRIAGLDVVANDPGGRP